MRGLQSFFQETLAYFGLARWAGEDVPPRRVGRDLLLVLFMCVWLGEKVLADRGTVVGSVAVALFLPALAVGLAGWMRRDTNPEVVDLEDTITFVPVMFAGLLLIVPDHLGVALPTGLTLIVSAVIFRAGRRKRRRRTLERNAQALPSQGHSEH